jgi:hypothetical protein
MVGAALTTLPLLAATDARAATPAVAPAPTYQAVGTVYAVTYSGGVAYVGGTFTTVRAPGTTSGGVTRNHVAAFDTTSGQLLSWNPNANGDVRAIAVGAGGVWLGGDFTTVTGQPRKRIAAVSPSSGSPTSWRVDADATVKALAFNGAGSVLYAAGNFASLGGQPRARLGAVNTGSSSVLTGWRADIAADGAWAGATSLTVVGTTLFVGGSFTTVNGVDRVNTAAVRTTDGAVSSWRADTPATILALASDASRVYAVGRGGGGFVAALDTSSGKRRWTANPNGDVAAVTVRGSEVYIGGHYDFVGNTTRHHLAALSAGTGSLLPWNPSANSSLGVTALAHDAGHIAAGGAFTVVAGRSQQGFAQFTG